MPRETKRRKEGRIKEMERTTSHYTTKNDVSKSSECDWERTQANLTQEHTSYCSTLESKFSPNSTIHTSGTCSGASATSE